MTLAKNARSVSAIACALVSSAGLPGLVVSTVAISNQAAVAQSSTSSDDAESRKAKRDLLIKLSKPVTLDVEDQPIADLFKFLSDVTEADIEPIYINDDISVDGIDPETEITIKVTEVPALVVLERLLMRAQRSEGTGQEYTWQFSEYDSIECGPKSELNRNQRVELYDVSDLLYLVPNFDNAPDFDLQSAVQAAGGGGGGGQSPFSGGSQDVEPVNVTERAQALEDLITSTVEPDQWAALGGDGGAITFYNQSFIITAPDYIHRQIAGYDFWPARLQQIRKVNGRQDIKIKPSTKP